MQAIAAGRTHVCALKDGAVSCWGDNAHGQVGTVGAQSLVPVAVSSADESVHSLFAGNDRTCFVRGGIERLGNNAHSTLGTAVVGEYRAR